MRIIDRYVLKQVVMLFATCLMTFMLLYVVIDILGHLDEILKQNTPLPLLLSYYLWSLPTILVEVSPFSCLLAVLYTFGKLNRDNEIIALRASGLSIWQIAQSILVVGALLSVAFFWVNDRLVPRSLFLTEKLKAQMEQQNEPQAHAQKKSLSNVCMYGMKNRLFFVARFDLDAQTMEGITILEHDNYQNILKKIVANRGVYVDGLWRFYQSITYEFDANGQIKNEPYYADEEIMAIPETPADFFNQRQHPDYMTIAELDEYIWKLSKSGATGVIRRLKIDLYGKFTKPWTTFLIVLLALPFALRVRKRAGLSSLGLSIMMGFLYYVVNAISIALGYAGVLPPFLAVSLSHLLVLCISLSLIISTP